MTKLKPQPVANYLLNQDSGHISELLCLAKSLIILNQDLKLCLPLPLGQECGIANIQNGKVTLYASSSAWCYKLRLHASTVANFLKQKGIPVSSVYYLVISPSVETATNSLPNPTISIGTANLLTTASKQMTNLSIKETLQRIANLCPKK